MTTFKNLFNSPEKSYEFILTWPPILKKLVNPGVTITKDYDTFEANQANTLQYRRFNLNYRIGTETSTNGSYVTLGVVTERSNVGRGRYLHIRNINMMYAFMDNNFTEQNYFEDNIEQDLEKKIGQLIHELRTRISPQEIGRRVSYKYGVSKTYSAGGLMSDAARKIDEINAQVRAARQLLGIFK